LLLNRVITITTMAELNAPPKDISVVIPVYNSEANLRELYRQIQDALKNIPHEVVFVNDGSSDGSWKIIEELVVANKNIVGVCLRKNFGQDNALMAGIHAASGNYLVIMDDDLQHSPYDIPKMYDQCIKGFDICYASFVQKKQRAWKNFGSWFNGVIATVLLNKPKDLYLSPFKIIKKDVVKEVLQYSGPFPYVDGLLLEVTRNVSYFQAEHFPRYAGKSNYNLVASVAVFLRTLTSFSVIPLRLATITGVITSVCGFIAAIYFTLEYFFTSHIVEGWTSLIISSLILGGLMLMFMGLIGEYLGRMFLTLNRKPQYSVRKTIVPEPR
jgi:polyisoprenyl-phosphate glycosyltransferase